MNKVIAIFLIMIFCFQINLKSYSIEICKKPSIDVEEINFNKVLNNKGKTWHTHESPDKNIQLVRYEDILDLETELKNNVKKAYIGLIRLAHKTTSIHLLEVVSNLIYDRIFIGKESDETKKKFLDFINSVLGNKKLSDKEKIDALIDGSTSGALAASGLTATGGIIGSSFAVGAHLLGASIGVCFATGGIAFILATYGLTKLYNNGLSFKAIELQNFGEKMENLYNSVKDRILRHNWIGNNLLIMSTTKQPECATVDSRFHNITGISYEKNQQEINEDFAKVECAFLGCKNDEHCENQALNVINCIFDKKAGKHDNKCPTNDSCNTCNINLIP